MSKEFFKRRNMDYFALALHNHGLKYDIQGIWYRVLCSFRLFSFNLQLFSPCGMGGTSTDYCYLCGVRAC